MIKAGIDTLAIYTSQYALDLEKLAQARGIDPAKYQTGLGQVRMSVPPPGEDIVTMAANAAQSALRDIDLSSIELVLFATESGTDQSKSAGLYIHELLGLPSRCRVVELKQACYAGTAGLQLALPFIYANPDKKVLLIGSDIARYGLGTTGESSQGSGACAMVLSANPRLVAFDKAFGVVAENAMDFWRPNYMHEALVEGKYSSKLYLSMLEKSWLQYQDQSQRSFSDHAYFCYHSPVPRLVEKAHQHLLKINHISLSPDEAYQQVSLSLEYARQLGNSYTASLYISLAAVLDLTPQDLSGQRIGFYSYGSGSVAEYFSGVVQLGYKKGLNTEHHKQLLQNRQSLTYDQYAAFYTFNYTEEGNLQEIPMYRTGHYRLAKLENHKRIYEKVIEKHPHLAPVNGSRKEAVDVLKVCAPGKLILSGEHSVLYGQPALAMAINRYVTATVAPQSNQHVLFDLSDLAHRSHLSFKALEALKTRVKRKYHRFISGDFSIREVLQKPFELAQYALSILTESTNIKLPHGVKLQVQSDIPIGCGMGSSAATIVSVMHAISHYLDVPLTKEALYTLALEAENMQHGRSSGLDLQVALKGGCLYVNGGDIETRPIPTVPLFLVNTGTPMTTTGQCVEKTAPIFKSTEIGDEFAAITKAMDAALLAQSWTGMKEAVRLNHELLVRIGVVPEKVKNFVEAIEALNGAAKICGAGAVAGDEAGALMVLTEDKKALSQVCERYRYNVIPIFGDAHGVHAA